ncbi:MAG: Ig-like domain-containing protein [Terrisporobacter sp.]
MKKKLISILLSLTMVLTVSAPAFAAEESGSIKRELASRESSITDILEDLLNKEDPEVEIKTGSIALNSTKKGNVDCDLSVNMYTLKLTSDQSINLNYKSNGLLLEVAMLNEEADPIWEDMLINKSEGQEQGNNVDLKLKKGKYILMVSATKGSFEVSPMTKSTTLKTMSPFTVNHVFPGASSVSGKGVAGAKITVYTDEYKTYKTTVKSDGTYKVTIPKQEDESSLVVKIEKPGYGARVSSVFVEKYYFKTFTINQVKSTSTTVTGKGTKDATVTAYVGSKKIGSSKVKSNGTYSIKIKKQPAGKEITVKMSKTNYYTEEEYVTVKKVFSKKLSVNIVKSTYKTVSGRGQSGATVKAYVGSKQIGSSKVKSNGTYSIKIKKQSKEKTIKVEMSKSGYAKTSKSIKVK